MGPLEIMALVNGLLGLAFNAWKTGRQVLGEDAIPEWADIIAQNDALQAKIDAEK
jgi:hypothetical protein